MSTMWQSEHTRTSDKGKRNGTYNGGHRWGSLTLLKAKTTGRREVTAFKIAAAQGKLPGKHILGEEMVGTLKS